MTDDPRVLDIRRTADPGSSEDPGDTKRSSLQIVSTEPAIIVYTSGSDRPPEKGDIISHRNLHV
jgi:acyl-CoA synthetase (AMP-forming)/AMP-acid ligase II